MQRIARTLFLAALLVCAGAGCWRSTEPSSTSSTTSSVITPTSTLSKPEPPKPPARTSWAETGLPQLHLMFTTPKGYWVYFSNQTLRYYLVPGTPPPPESPDPDVEARAKAVAYFYVLQNTDADSFPSWERFELTMAQFDCPEGTTPETHVSCLATPSRESSGPAGAGVTYHAFSLPLVLTQTKASRGTRSYVVAKIGAAEQYGILFRALNSAASTPMLTLAKSVRVE